MMEPRQRRARPSLEGLEGRTLLNGSKIPAIHTLATGPTVTAATTNRFDYRTADGAKVHVVLLGPGTLTGTALDSSGNLNLVFSGTGVFSQIVGTVQGGSKQAGLGTIRNGNIPLSSTTGVGGELIGRIKLPEFNLVAGGNINLLAGVDVLSLNSVAANSQLHLRDTPLNTTLGISTTVDPLTGAGLGYSGNQPYHTISTITPSTSTTTSTAIGGVSGVGTLDPTISGFGGLGVGAINGAIPIINTVGNGQNLRGTPGLTQAQVSFGRSLAYAFETTNVNAIRLNSVAGSFTPGVNLIEPRDISLPLNARRVPPPGVILTIKHVNGGATPLNPPLGDPNVFGFDPATNSLIRFDATTGAVLNTIRVPGATTTSGIGGVALARNGAELVALVGVGATVQAYDALSGVFVGQFTTPRTVGGIATNNGTTIVLDPSTAPNGVAQAINVSASLLAGSAVTTGAPFAPAREFLLAGGVTGVPGTSNLYALGAGFLDPAQPNRTQAGILTIVPTPTGSLAEVARTALTSSGVALPAASNGTIANNPSRALGSIESSLALDTGVVNGQNTITLLNPVTLATQGAVNLNYPNALSGLSNSFHPEITGSALIDVQGNIQSFTAQSANGLILNDAGNLDLLAIKNAANSSVVALPFGHVQIAVRNNVSILTNSRLVGTRGDVTVVPTARQVGPLTLP